MTTKKFYTLLSALVVLALLAAACGAQPLDKQIADACAKVEPGSTIPLNGGTITCAGKVLAKSENANGEPTPTAAAGNLTIDGSSSQGVTLDPIIALKYDEDGQGELADGQNELAAIPVRRAQSGVWSATSDDTAQKAMTDQVVAIQKMAAAAGATTKEEDKLTLDFGATWLVWCSNSTNVDAPADVAVPLKIKHLGWGQLYIWAPPAHYDLAPDPSLRTFTGCTGAKFWAVALR